MNGMQTQLRSACKRFGLDVFFDVVVILEDGICLEVPAHVVHLGAARGMLLFTEAASMWPLRVAIERAGYGYSILSNRPIEEDVDIDTFKEMFMDWGWSGEAALKPGWFE